MSADDLAAMGSEVAALDGELLDADNLGPEPVGGAAPGGRDPVAETREVFGLVVMLLTPVAPYLPDVYTPEKLDQLSAAYVPVSEKYGWDVGGVLEQYGAEIALIGVAAPLAIQTAVAHRAHKACRAQEAEAERFRAMRREADAAAHFTATRGTDQGQEVSQGGATFEAGPADGN